MQNAPVFKAARYKSATNEHSTTLKESRSQSSHLRLPLHIHSGRKFKKLPELRDHGDNLLSPPFGMQL